MTDYAMWQMARERPATPEYAEKVRAERAAKLAAYLASCPKCAVCGGQLYQSQNPKRQKADGSQSWRHWETQKVKAADGHKAVPA